MAEGLHIVSEECKNINKEDECAVCLQALQHPARLPCNHIFCFLCIKGIVNQGGRCALCRQPISVDYLDNPVLLEPIDFEVVEKQFQWYYEGQSGWWQYDERTTIDLEIAYKEGVRNCHILVAGYLYVADFDSMMQYRRGNPGRRRRIKRDIATLEIKGVAGIRVQKPSEPTSAPSSSRSTSPGSFHLNDLITRTQHLNLNDDPDIEVVDIVNDGHHGSPQGSSNSNLFPDSGDRSQNEVFLRNKTRDDNLRR